MEHAKGGMAPDRLDRDGNKADLHTNNRKRRIADRNF
jgi:hypothetical protein